jgi:hypothetical protein
VELSRRLEIKRDKIRSVLNLYKETDCGVSIWCGA